MSAAYSIGFLVACIGLIVLAQRHGIFAPTRSLATRVLAGSALEAGRAGGALYALRDVVAPVIGAMVVALIAGASIVGLGLVPALRAWIRRPTADDDGAELVTG